jgi:hypothetical protein
MPNQRSENLRFFHQTRHDLTEKLTILGCTLFSKITDDQEDAVAAPLVDFKDILRWTVDDQNVAHNIGRIGIAPWINKGVF